MRRALGLLALLVVAALCITRIVEHDTPWYLAAGDLILRTHALPSVDPFSYTSTKAWLNHEWLAEVVLALGYRAGGFVALGVLQGLTLAFSVGIIAWATRKREGFLGLSTLVWIVVVFVLREWTGPRAQLLSVPCFALTLTLTLVQGDDDALLWWCIPIQLAWTQLHGGNPTGVALVGIAFVASPSLRRAVVVVLCAVATIVGPYGFRVHRHFLGSHAALPNIREWEPLAVALSNGSIAHWVVVALVIASFVSLRGRTGATLRRDALLLLVFSVVAIRYQRFAIECCMVAAAILAPTLGRATQGRWSAVTRIGLAVLMSSGFALATIRSPGVGLEPSRFPLRAVDWLKQAHPVGPMFNSYNYGGYLLWAWPEQPVFVDGRAFTVYDDALVASLPALYADPPRFADLQARYGFRLAVLQRVGRGESLVAWLRTRPEWQVVYEDAMTLIFVRSS